MRPPKKEFERVPTGIEIKGTIEKVQYDENYIFKARNEDEEDKKGIAVRFKFKLDGCEYAHYTRWGRLSTNEKSNLYKKYLVELVANITPNADFDLDELNGMRVITTWVDNGEYQNLETIVADGSKITVDITEAEIIDDGDAPF
jgi:hypothetical protein